MKSDAYRIEVEVTLIDPRELREYALKRALESGNVTLADFANGEVYASDGAYALQENIKYWLGWAFDAGTPLRCGFQIEESRVEKTFADAPLPCGN